MNANYFVGRLLSTVRNGTLRRLPSRLRNAYPRGRYLSLDLARLANGEPIRTILDVGANDGGTVTEFARWFPGATIHAFEPIADTFSRLQRNVAGYRNVQLHRLACGATAAQVAVTLKAHSTLNSLVGATPASTPGTNTDAEVVQVVTLRDFCRDREIQDVDLLKTDTEGFDIEVLRGAGALIDDRRVRFIYIEVGFDRQDCQTPFPAVADYLHARGYHLGGFYEQARRGAHKQFMPFCDALFVRGATT